MKPKNTVKSNLNTLVKTYYIKLKEIESRDTTKEVKINELRSISDKIQGTIAVIEHTGSYIEEMSLLLSLRREGFNIMQRYVE